MTIWGQSKLNEFLFFVLRTSHGAALAKANELQVQEYTVFLSRKMDHLLNILNCLNSDRHYAEEL